MDRNPKPSKHDTVQDILDDTTENSDLTQIMSDASESVPVVIAKVRPETQWGEAREARAGSKHFRANAKVYIIHGDGGNCRSVAVIGHHRKSGRYIRIRMDVKYFQDFKLGYLYSPKGISLYDEFFQLNYPSGYRPTKEDMSDLASYLPNWQTP